MIIMSDKVTKFSSKLKITVFLRNLLTILSKLTSLNWTPVNHRRVTRTPRVPVLIGRISRAHVLKGSLEMASTVRTSTSALMLRVVTVVRALTSGTDIPVCVPVDIITVQTVPLSITARRTRVSTVTALLTEMHTTVRATQGTPVITAKLI